ncbi:MAG: hypothetical protein BJ554DRAFT_2595 [Olpidium bornovanus]|uniref:Uncharacterized protein n=1 Tax=Olpidium bornovanus TaxID=278681 RepID=A0A8H7ZQJ4_9FUNG|nr:MAG: hypothetical protein BJ554DRAFT_2595 [Olpidium bornovanus]
MTAGAYQVPVLVSFDLATWAVFMAGSLLVPYRALAPPPPPSLLRCARKQETRPRQTLPLSAFPRPSRTRTRARARSAPQVSRLVRPRFAPFSSPSRQSSKAAGVSSRGDRKPRPTLIRRHILSSGPPGQQVPLGSSPQVRRVQHDPFRVRELRRDAELDRVDVNIRGRRRVLAARRAAVREDVDPGVADLVNGDVGARGLGGRGHYGFRRIPRTWNRQRFLPSHIPPFPLLSCLFARVGGIQNRGTARDKRPHL